MVYLKDGKNRSNQDHSELMRDSTSEHGMVTPQFIVDDDGIPYDKMQTDYEKIIHLKLKERYPNEFEKMLTCLHCDHYKNDDCFFPKREIDKIEKDRVEQKISCAFCGTKIHRLFSILMSLYYKDKFGVNIPIICCACYASLNNNTLVKNIQRRMILFAISLSTALYFLIMYFLSIFIYNVIGLILVILPLTFWVYIMIRDIKNLYFLWRGKKYYEQIFVEKEDTEKDTDNSDKKDNEEHPAPGAYDSPGYEY